MAKGRAPVVYFCKEVIYRAFSNTNLALFLVTLHPAPVFLNLDSILLTIINHLSCLGKFIKSKNRGVNGSSRSGGFDIGSKFNCCGSWIEHRRKIEMYSIGIHRNTNCISLVQQNWQEQITWPEICFTQACRYVRLANSLPTRYWLNMLDLKEKRDHKRSCLR